jgi:hypothetical protein
MDDLRLEVATRQLKRARLERNALALILVAALMLWRLGCTHWMAR